MNERIGCVAGRENHCLLVIRTQQAPQKKVDSTVSFRLMKMAAPATRFVRGSGGNEPALITLSSGSGTPRVLRTLTQLLLTESR